MIVFRKEAWVLFILFVLGLLLFATQAVSLQAPDDLRRDLDGDGIKESQLIMEGGVIQQAVTDYDLDGVPEMVIQYKNGRRDVAFVDVDHDGSTDTWIFFYFTGVPWKVAEDYNGDGQPDYWLHLQNGEVYRWEQDRNGDGWPDVRTVAKSQVLDDDFDGIFERRMRGRSLSGLVPQKLGGLLMSLPKGAR